MYEQDREANLGILSSGRLKGGAWLDTELRLIRKIQKSGDRTAADTIIRTYYDEIHRFIRIQTQDNEAALDLTQEVFIIVLKSIGRYDPQKGACFRTWLYKIATNKTVDHFRSRTARYSQTISLDEIQPVDETDFTRRLEDKDFVERVCKYIGSFSVETEKILRLHIFGGYTFFEIAKDLSIPESSVKSKYYRLLNVLRKEFASNE